MSDKQSARTQIEDLVTRFTDQYESYKNAGYNPHKVLIVSGSVSGGGSLCIWFALLFFFWPFGLQAIRKIINKKSTLFITD